MTARLLIHSLALRACSCAHYSGIGERSSGLSNVVPRENVNASPPTLKVADACPTSWTFQVFSSISKDSPTAKRQLLPSILDLTSTCQLPSRSLKLPVIRVPFANAIVLGLVFFLTTLAALSLNRTVIVSPVERSGRPLSVTLKVNLYWPSGCPGIFSVPLRPLPPAMNSADG